MKEIVNLSKIIGAIKRWKKSLVPMMAVAVGFAASQGVSAGEEVQNDAEMPDVSDEQKSIDKIDSNIDQTEKKLEQLEQVSDDSDQNDYALMGC